MPRSAAFLLCALTALLCSCPDSYRDAQKTLFNERTDTGVTSTNQLLETENFNIVEYLYYYNGGGVAATDINGDGLPDLYFTNNQGPNKYYINEGDFKFRDATEEGGVAGAGDWSTGVSILDVNQDGRMDIYVCNVSGYKGLAGRNELFLQNEDGTFTEAAANYGLDLPGFNTQAYWFDYDLDGDLDLYLARHSVHNDATYGTAEGRYVPDSLAGDLLLRNDFISIPSATSEIENQISRIENRESSPLIPPTTSPLGEGPGERGRAASPPTSALPTTHYPLSTFQDVTQPAGILSSKIAYALSAAIADFNTDGYPDLYVCNDFSENDYYYLNNGDGTFREAVDSLTGHTSNFSMGSDVADFDADGRPDLLTLDMRPGNEETLKATMSSDAWNVYQLKRKLGYHHQLPHNALQWNRGGGNFSEIAEMAGLAATDWSWSCLVEDFDRDGRPDVFVANGIERRPNSLDYLKFISSSLARSASNLEVIANMPDGHVANQAFRNTGEWAFEETSATWGLDYTGSSTGAAVADFDQDGDLDLALNNLNAPAKIYENTVLAPGDLTPEELEPARADILSKPGRWSPQRGFQSQSEGDYPVTVPPANQISPIANRQSHISDPPTSASPPTPQIKNQESRIENRELRISIRPTAILHTTETGKLFDRDPLAPYAPSPVNYPLIFLKDGSYAIATNDVGNQYRTYRWNGQSFEGGDLAPIFAVQHQQVRGPARMPLKVLLPEDQETIYARTFSTITQQMSGGSVDAVPERSGMWQSLSQINGEGEAGTTLLAGNWGLNSVLGTPTPAAPLRLYSEDVDGNGDQETLLTYVRQGREITVADKDELTAQIPSLKRNQLSYTDYAAKSFSDLFGELKSPPQAVSSLEHLLLTRRNGGDWSSEPLPRATQITTLNCALEIPQGILLGGNKLEVQPRIGRQDAAALQLLRPDGTVTFIDLGGERNRLEVRQLVRLDDGHVLVLVGGGEHLILAI